jgi:signal transduction histidine kinase
MINDTYMRRNIMMALFNIKRFGYLFGLFLFVISSQVLAIEQLLNVTELKDFVNSGVEHLKHTSKEQAYKEFSDVHGKFVKNGKYFFVYNFQGECLAHGGNPTAHVGKNLLSFKDKFGVPVIPLLIDIAKGGGGLAGYYWPNPKTKQQQFRLGYVMAIDDKTLIGSGFFVE